MRLLIVYGTTDGMTERIAEHMAEVVRGAGHLVRVTRADDLRFPSDLADFDGVLVGASLHAGGFQRSVARFVRGHAAALAKRPNAFFSVCLAAASRDPRERQAAARIAAAFPRGLGWIPDRTEVIAGALMFSRYGFLRRFALKRIAQKELGAIDASRDHVYTDWPAVDRFVLDFVAAAGGRTSIGAAARA